MYVKLKYFNTYLSCIQYIGYYVIWILLYDYSYYIVINKYSFKLVFVSHWMLIVWVGDTFSVINKFLCVKILIFVYLPPDRRSIS